MLATFTFVLPIYQSDLRLLVRQLEAVSSQTVPWWRCVIVDDGSADPEPGRLAHAWCAREQRAKFIQLPANTGIAAATNVGIAASDTDFVVFIDHDDIVASDAIESFTRYVRSRPDTDVIYSDETLVSPESRVLFEYCKPDWSPERLLGQPYINHLTAVRHHLLDGRPLRPQREPCQDFDLLHRVTVHARHVGHVGSSLYRWRAVDGSTAKAAAEKPHVASSVTNTVADALERAGESAVAFGHPRDPNCVIVRRPVAGQPSVAIIAIEAGSATAIDRALRSVEADIAILLDAGDLGAVSDDVLLVDQRAGEQARHHGWYQALVAQVQRPDVCAAGPMVLTTGSKVWSAGRVLNPLHDLYAGEDRDSSGPWGSFFVAREVAALSPTGWTVAVERYLDLGGIRTDLPLDVALADYSVRGAASGQRTIWSPQCTVTTERAPFVSNATVNEIVSGLAVADPVGWTDHCQF